MSDLSELPALVSTVVSSIALVFIALALVMQVRQLQLGRLQASRATFIDVMRIGIEYPHLLPADSIGETEQDHALTRTRYINLVFKYLEFSYAIRAISKASVRLQARAMFDDPLRYAFWERSREVYRLEAHGRRERQFFRLVDDVFDGVTRDRGRRQSAGQPVEQPAPAVPAT